MRSQEKNLIPAQITRKDGHVSYGKILPEEEINLTKKGFKVKHITESELKEKELKKVVKTKELK